VSLFSKQTVRVFSADAIASSGVYLMEKSLPAFPRCLRPLCQEPTNLLLPDEKRYPMVIAGVLVSA
jgi:hypothetical protein